MPVNVFSDEDVGLLRDFCDQLRRGRGNPQSRTPSRDFDDVGGDSPDVYIAIPQDSHGIPAVSHTGVFPGEGDAVGQGVCDIFRIVGGGDLIPIGFSENVYNFSTSVIPRMWIPVQRTKFGDWVASRVTEIVEGILLTKLKPAAGPLTGATTCDILVIERFKSSSPEFDENGQITVPADWATTKKRIRVINRSVNFKGAPGTYGVFENLGGEFRPLVIDCAISEEGIHLIVDIFSDTYGGFVYGG